MKCHQGIGFLDSIIVLKLSGANLYDDSTKVANFFGTTKSATSFAERNKLAVFVGFT